MKGHQNFIRFDFLLAYEGENDLELWVCCSFSLS